MVETEEDGIATILHIEDEPRNRLLVRKLLRAAGHEVVDAESGIEAIEIAQPTRPDLVLVDINIPGLDGYEVILRLRAIPDLARVPIVTITAEGERQTSLAVGADGFISKPIDARHNEKIVEEYLKGFRETAGDRGPERLRERSQVIVQRLESKVRELSSANERLEEMARLRREFLRNTSHELATPLTPIIGYLKLLIKGELGPLNDMQQKSLVSMETSMQRLRQVVDTLLDVSALESGRMRLMPRSYDFALICSEAIRESQPLIEDRNVTMVSSGIGIQMPAFGDGAKLKRAIIHLLDNAIKFSPEGASVGLEVQREERDSGEFFTCAVADNGPGVSPNIRKRIFEPFYQADGSPTRAYGGVGLGLAFVRQVVDLSSGTVELESPPEQEVAGRSFTGSLFRLSVPSNIGEPS